MGDLVDLNAVGFQSKHGEIPFCTVCQHPVDQIEWNWGMGSYDAGGYLESHYTGDDLIDVRCHGEQAAFRRRGFGPWYRAD